MPPTTVTIPLPDIPKSRNSSTNQSPSALVSRSRSPRHLRGLQEEERCIENGTRTKQDAAEARTDHQRDSHHRHIHANGHDRRKLDHSKKAVDFAHIDNDIEIEEDDDDHLDMMSEHSILDRPPLYRPTDGRSGTPLLPKKSDDVQDLQPNDSHGRGRSRYDHLPPTSPSQFPPPVVGRTSSRPVLSRRSTMRSGSPDTQARMAVRKKYAISAVFLVVTLVSFCVQTELGRYVQHELGWNKAYCMLYLTHGSWALLWPTQLLILRAFNWNVPWSTFWRRHLYVLRSTAHMVAEQQLEVPRHVLQQNPLPYIIRTTSFITSALTVGGLCWYVAVNLTSPSDLTAIYNTSAFFAYAFSVPLLKEKLRLDKSIAVLIAIAGVLIVAYGDSKETGEEGEASTVETGSRFLGNIIIGAGSVLYGLYEVLYKRYACPPEGTSATRGMVFANAFGSCIGAFTLLVLWIPIPVLHVLGWEIFELPRGEAAFYLFISVIMNATFAGSFLVLISLTSPVLSSVAALLTIFLVAAADWFITGEPISLAALAGGLFIIVAFLMLSWSTWREMTEDAAERKAGYEAPVDYSSEDSDKDDDRLD